MAALRPLYRMAGKRASTAWEKGGRAGKIPARPGKEKREKRLLAYADMIQSAVQQDSSDVLRQLVEERKRQRLTQQELSDITGVRTSNIARFEGGTRIPTLLMLEKYANALGKHIEVSIRDKE